MNLDVNQGRELAYRPPRSMARPSLLRHRSHPFRIRWNLKTRPHAHPRACLPFPLLIPTHWNESRCQPGPRTCLQTPSLYGASLSSPTPFSPISNPLEPENTSTRSPPSMPTVPAPHSDPLE